MSYTGEIGPKTVYGNETASQANPHGLTGDQVEQMLLFTQSGTGAVQRTLDSKVKDFVSVKDFGAVGDGATDDAAAVQAAFTASSRIYFPPGKYKLSVNIAKTMANAIDSFTVVGAGPDKTILFWPNANGGLSITYAGGLNNSVTLSDFSCTTAQAGGGTAINLFNSVSNASPANAAQNNLSHITFRGDDGYSSTNYWTTCIAINNVSSNNLNGIYFSGPTTRAGTGIVMVGLPASTTFAVVLNIASSIFNNLGVGVFYGNYVQGISVHQSQFNGCNNGIDAGSTETGLDQLVVTSSQFGLVGSQVGIQTSSPVYHTTIANNLFIINGSSTNAISLSSAAYFNIHGNELECFNTTGTTGINIGTMDAGTSGVIKGNQIYGFATAISLGASSINVLVEGNNFLGHSTSISLNTTNISDSGTGNLIINNAGYNIAWTAFTPTVVVTGGTGTATGSYQKNGKTVHFQMAITCTGSGTLSTTTLPFTANSRAMFAGREMVRTGTGWVGWSTGASNTMSATTVSNSAAMQTNDILSISGTYEST